MKPDITSAYVNGGIMGIGIMLINSGMLGIVTKEYVGGGILLVAGLLSLLVREVVKHYLRNIPNSVIGSPTVETPLETETSLPKK